MKIILRAPSHVGDQIMARRFYLGVRDRFPTAHLTLLAPRGAQALCGDFFDDAIETTRAEKRNLRDMIRLAQRIGQRKYDLALCLPHSVSSALVFAWARVPRRIGFAKGGSGWFHTQSLAWRGRASGLHKSALYLSLLELVGPNSDRDSHSADFLLEARTREIPLAAGSVSSIPQNKRLSKKIVLAPGASIPLREWPYFWELADRLAVSAESYRIVLVGGSEQAQRWRPRLTKLARSNIEDRVGQTTLPELIQLCEGASLVVANDSGVAHIASTLARAPTVVLFGPGDPEYASPQNSDVAPLIVRKTEVPCSPCERTHCLNRARPRMCLRDLSLDEVLDAVLGILKKDPDFRFNRPL